VHPDRIISVLAAPQHGVVSLDQLRRAGLSRGQLERKVTSGRLERIFPRVFLVGGSLRSWDQRCLAACLSIGPGVVVSHRAAARLHGLRLPGDAPVELTTPRPRTPKTRGVTLHRSTDLVDQHAEAIRAIPTTNVHRLLVDLGAVLPAFLVADALEQMVASRRVTPVSARAFLETVARRGRDGAGVLRHVLDDRALGDQVSDSGLEARTARLCRDANLPKPVFQYWIELAGGWRRLDFCYPEQLIAIEIDGYEAHSGRVAFEDDRVRGNELEVLGWLVLHFTWQQVVKRPEYVAGVLRRALASRAARPPQTGAVLHA
jgi:very-short-patch-repair endonuclease